MHIFSVSFGVLTSLSALFMDLYNDANLWCWISSYPSGCEGDECIRGRDNFPIFRWSFFFVPLWVCAIVITAIMISIYLSVRQRESEAIAASENDGGRRSSLVRLSMTKDRKSFAFGNSGLFCSPVFPGDRGIPTSDSTQQKEDEDRPKRKGRRPSKQTVNLPAREASLAAEQRPSIIIPQNLAEIFKSMKSVNRQYTEQSDAEFVLQMIESLPSAKQQAVQMNSFGSRAVYMQALYYTCAFYITYTFATVNRLVQQVTGKTYFPIVFLHAMLLPLQGFFNGKVSKAHFSEF